MRAVVVGAGLIGLTTALYLRRAGADVTVIDRAEGSGLETSFANGGLLTPGIADPWNSPGVFRRVLRSLGDESSPVLLRPGAIVGLGSWGVDFVRQSRPDRFRRNLIRNVRLANYTLSLMAALREEYPLDYDGRCSGSLKLLRDPVSLRQSVAMAESLVAEGIQHEVLDRDETVAREPALAPIRDRIAGSVYFRADEIGDAHKFCREIERILRHLAVTFRFGVKVNALEVGGGRVTRLRTSDGSIAADAYVIAAGSHSTELCKPLGLRLPVRPVKGYSITVDVGDWSAPPALPILDDSLHAVVVPLGDRIRVAGTAELAGYDRELRPERIRNLVGLLEQSYPDFAAGLDSSQIHPWTGLRPMSSDGVPIIGATALENLFLNTGHGPLGWTLAAGSGKILADLMTGGATMNRAEDYAPARFDGSLV